VASRVKVIIRDESFYFSPQDKVKKKDITFSVKERAREGEITSYTTFLIAILYGI